ncbi:MAG TPA: acyltransferase family protein [Xanthobacteraceae bacterium]
MPRAPHPPSREPSLIKSSTALSNLRAVVILIVLAFHSMLAYLGSAPQSTPSFDVPPYGWKSFPIVDTQRWFGFDLFCAWNDVYLMSLLFFLSGVFVWPSLARKGTITYLRDRLLRLALPLCLAEFFLMPVALYPTYLLTAVSPSPTGYWHAWRALPFWPCGPQWFLWQLLALNTTAAIVYSFAPNFGTSLARWATSLGERPSHFFIALAAASALAYVPLAVAFTPWQWTEWGPFAFQLSRPLHYCVYFAAGIAAGGWRLDGGLLAANGMLPRRWAAWLVAAAATFLLWIIPMALIVKGITPDSMLMQIAVDVCFSLACAGSCMFALAAAIRFATFRARILDSLSRNAYRIYIIHYPFVVWLQYALLGQALPAPVKALMVFGATLLLSWPASAAIGGIPGWLLRTAGNRKALRENSIGRMAS